MKCTVIQQFNRRGVPQFPGNIIDVPEDALEKLADFVEPLNGSEFSGAVQIETPEGDRLWVATTTDAIKLIPAGAVFFTAPEIMALQQTGREAGQAMLKVKQIFGNEALLERIELTGEDLRRDS